MAKYDSHQEDKWTHFDTFAMIVIIIVDGCYNPIRNQSTESIELNFAKVGSWKCASQEVFYLVRLFDDDDICIGKRLCEWIERKKENKVNLRKEIKTIIIIRKIMLCRQLNAITWTSERK